MEMAKKTNLMTALGFIVFIEAIGFLSGWLAGDSGAVYQLLVKPPLSPPGWLFGVVWPIMYAIIGLAAYFAHSEKTPMAKEAMFWFWLQLALNFLWSIVFFRFELFWAAFVVILLLDAIVIYTIILFTKVNRKSVVLMIPYLIWLLYASYLNLGFAILN